jgi:antitoxin component of RelBE/YafQ-DinJ toxin-antitoxin module
VIVIHVLQYYNQLLIIFPKSYAMTLSVRVDRDLEAHFELEIKRLGTTKSEFVNKLLRQALAPKDPMQLLLDIRSKYGIAEPNADTPRTNNSSKTKERAAQVLKGKRRASSAG